jgi:hypothetical protein
MPSKAEDDSGTKLNRIPHRPPKRKNTPPAAHRGHPHGLTGFPGKAIGTGYVRGLLGSVPGLMIRAACSGSRPGDDSVGQR